LIGPRESVVAGSKTDLSTIRFSVHDFEEHVPRIIVSQHKRIGDERGWYVCNAVFRQHRLGGL
jgi:hypothetical protein